ncbi:MAG: DUF6499 domain-containing protein [Methylorubrum populi]
MIEIDWRSASGYRYAKTIPAAGFAWEYLRRHAEYRQDAKRLTEPDPPEPCELDRFTERWGLRFPARSRQDPRRQARHLDPTA